MHIVLDTPPEQLLDNIVILQAFELIVGQVPRCG